MLHTSCHRTKVVDVAEIRKTGYDNLKEDQMGTPI